MDLVQVEGLEGREVFNINLNQEPISDVITWALKKATDFVEVHALSVPVIQGQVLTIIRISSDGERVNFLGKLKLTGDVHRVSL